MLPITRLLENRSAVPIYDYPSDNAAIKSVDYSRDTHRAKASVTTEE